MQNVLKCGAFAIFADKNPTYPVGTCVSAYGSSVVVPPSRIERYSLPTSRQEYAVRK